MSENRFAKPKKEKPKKDTQTLRKLFKLLDESFFIKEKIVSALPFLYFLTLLAIIYIANTYYADKLFKETRKIEQELEELKFEYTTSIAELSNISKQSEVIKKVDTIGLKELTRPFKKIVVKRDELENWYREIGGMEIVERGRK